MAVEVDERWPLKIARCCAVAGGTEECICDGMVSRMRYCVVVSG
jgi:hypothetical protein